MPDKETENIAKFRSLLSEFDDAMLVSADERGHPHARPMRIAAQSEERLDDLWFVTSAHAGKIDEIRSEPRVAVVMSDGKRFLSISGHARVVVDRAKIEELWAESWKLWFPDGPQSSDIALIQVRPLRGEYWDQSFPRGLRFALEAAKALLKDEPIDEPTKSEYHAKVNLG